ncbi:Nucleotidyltransferase [Xylaria nigripes]|nr:Nucleotidyltransferase [Xylaria nigripes]
MAADLVFPPIFLLSTHFEPDELSKLESEIPTLTYDISKAEIVLGKVAKKPRARLELRARGLFTQEVNHRDDDQPSSLANSLPPGEGIRDGHETAKSISRVDDSVVEVVRLAWFTDSLVKGKVLPVDEYLVYRGRKKTSPLGRHTYKLGSTLKRAREDDDSGDFQSSPDRSDQAHATQHPRSARAKRPRLVQESTSEHEKVIHLPPMPDFLNTTYSCQRPTPFDSPNSAFIEEVKKIRTIRELEGDEVGVRAYSTSVAALAAYPYPLSSASEIARLPGCGRKIVELYKQWQTYRYLNDVREAASDPKTKVLLLFYDIWGVGAKTANDFYNRGWRDLDDIVERGWDQITRVQQIGVKYYDELQAKIPRAEVEDIAGIILEHANKAREGFQLIIVGGYRRGKTASSDVDVVLSHPDPSATLFFVNEILTSLEKSNYVTHTLTLSNKNSERGQIPVAWKGEHDKPGSGFDTLDKALLVWQDPRWDTTKASKNPNPHRRVDIIVSPWKTVGCAIVGWTGATTFERDLRLYCKKEKGLKFDSSGVRTRTDGHWLALEDDADGNSAPDMITAEKRVFEKLGLQWRAPDERCTS